MIGFGLTVGLALASTQLSASGGAPVPIQAPDFDATSLSTYISSFVGPGRLPGVAVAVVGRDGPLYQAGFGRMEDSREPVTAAALFRTGPFAHAITALAILQLTDSGRISLDAPVQRYLPELAFRNRERTRRLTVHHLVTHTSGLTAMSAFNRRVRLERRLDHIDVSQEPGTHRQASPINGMILEAVIESVTGRKYDDWVSEHLFGPLGMRSSTVRREVAREGYVPRGHQYFFGWLVPIRDRSAADGSASSAGVVSSAEDIGRFLSLFLNGGRLVDRQFLSADGVAVMMEPPTVEPGRVSDNHLVQSARAPSLERSGGESGFHAALAVLPGGGYGVVVLANRAGGPLLSAPDALMEGILARISGGESAPYLPWERLLHVGLLVLLSAQGWITLRWRRRWRALGGPRATAHTVPIISRFVLDFTVAAALPLVFLLGVAEMPIQAVLAAYPDWGLTTILLPVLLVPTAVWRNLVRSEKWRAHAEHARPASTTHVVVRVDASGDIRPE